MLAVEPGHDSIDTAQHLGRIYDRQLGRIGQWLTTLLIQLLVLVLPDTLGPAVIRDIKKGARLLITLT